MWRRLFAAAYGCALLLLVTFALDELAVSQATAPKRTYQASEHVRNRITPLGGKHQSRLVIYTKNSSGIKCTPLSSRFGQIDYHYKLQDSAKMCPSVLKCHQLQGGFAPQTPVIGSRSRARHSSPPFCSPTGQLQTTSDVTTPTTVW